jgi:hypothetical protein
LHTRLDYGRSIEVAGFGAVLRLLDDRSSSPARDAFDLTFRVWLSPQLGGRLCRAAG